MFTRYERTCNSFIKIFKNLVHKNRYSNIKIQNIRYTNIVLLLYFFKTILYTYYKSKLEICSTKLK